MNDVKERWKSFTTDDSSHESELATERRRLHQDILDRAASADTKHHASCAGKLVHGWLFHEEEPLNPYKLMPPACGYEKSVCGLDEAYLQRIEEFWMQRQASLDRTPKTAATSV